MCLRVNPNKDYMRINLSLSLSVCVCVCVCVLWITPSHTLCSCHRPSHQMVGSSLTAGHSTDGSCPVGSAVGSGLSAISLPYVGLALCHGINIQYFWAQFLESQLRVDSNV